MRRMYNLIIWLLLVLSAVLDAGAAEVRDPEIQICVLEEGMKSASVSAETGHRWLIRCTLPPGPYCRYAVTQTLSPGLTMDPGSLNVSLPDGDVLTMELHYLFTAGSVQVEGGCADRICIELTEAGNALFAFGGDLLIKYEANIRSDAPLGTQLVGSAQLRCSDGEGTGAVYTSDKASVSTGGFSISVKTAAGVPIPGAGFMLAREASTEEREKEYAVTEILDTGTDILSVVYVPFLNAAGDRTYTVKTDAEGKALCSGLAYGKYYLVQTELPEGWGLRVQPVPVCVNEVSHLTARDGWRSSDGTVADHTVRIVNSQLMLPQSGGPGTAAFTLSGLAVILSAVLLLWLNRKRSIRLQ